MTGPELLPEGIDWEQLGLWNLSVFPLQHKGKRPCRSWRDPDADSTFKDDSERARQESAEWECFQTRLPTNRELHQWSRLRGLNAAVACGKVSGIIVLDTDSEKAEADVVARGSPRTPTVKTAKGRHRYYAWPGFEVHNTAGFRKSNPGLDLRGDGGYVVAAGSVHPSGHVYAWEITPAEAPYAPAPEWLLELIRTKTKGGKRAGGSDGGDVERPELPAGGEALPPGAAFGKAALDKALVEILRAPAGAHNDTLNRRAYEIGGLIGAGVPLDRAEVERALIGAGVSIGQDRDRAADTVKRALDDGIAAPRELPEGLLDKKTRRRTRGSTVDQKRERDPRPHGEEARASSTREDDGRDGGHDPDEYLDGVGPLPIVPLGQRDGAYFLLARSHEHRTLDTRSLTANGLLSLFDGDASWLIARCPEAPRRKGQKVATFDVRAAAAWIMRLCAKRGLYDADVALRGPGVWAVPPPKGGMDPVLLIHVGDRLWLDGDWLDAGQVVGEAIYPAFPKLAPPMMTPDKAALATAGLVTGEALGEQLRKHVDLWKFKSDLYAGLIVGFIGMALLGAGPRWRVHVLLTGERGCGKSHLVKLIVAALGAMVREFNRYTEPGLRQVLNRYARAVALDEAEGSSMRVQPVIELLRNMAGDEGVKSVLGASDQNAATGSVVGSVLMSAINAPQLLPQDRSRIFAAEMVKNTDSEAAAKVDAAIAWCERHSALLWARAIEGWPRYQQALGVFKVALMGAGCDSRQADMFAALLAGRDMLLHDHAITADDAAPLVKRLAPLITIIKLDDELDSDPAQCLARLLSSQVERWSRGGKSTIGALIQECQWRDPGDAERARETLKNHGIRFEETEADFEGKRYPFLLVAHRHDALTRIFTGTPWEGGGWRTALSRLADAVDRQNPVHFTGIKVRAVEIPWKWLPMSHDPDATRDVPT